MSSYLAFSPLPSQAVYFSVALSVALADTFLLRSTVLCAVPTFLAPAFPTRDSLPESRCKITEFLFYGTAKPLLFGKIKQDFRFGKAHFATQMQHFLSHLFIDFEPDLTVGSQLGFR